jgi:hypothetical protein
MRCQIRCVFVLVALFSSTIGGALASRVYHSELSEVIRSERPVISAVVRKSEVHILPNRLEVSIHVDLVEPVFLQPPTASELTYSFSTMLDRVQPDGTTIRVSPIRDGSGIEQNLEVGHRYLFILEPKSTTVIRAERMSSLAEIRSLLNMEDSQ